jgi:hypothetical protein
MKSGKDLRDSKGRSIESTSPKEVMAVMFVMVEAASGAFRLRLVSNDDLIRDLKAQGAMEGFLADVDQLYAEFRSRFEETGTPRRLN